MADEPLGGHREGVRPGTLKAAAIGGVAVGGAFVLLSVFTKRASSTGTGNATTLPGGSNASTGEPGSNLDAAQSGVSGSSTAPSYISEYINEGNTTTTTTGGASGAAAQSYGVFGTVDPLGNYIDANGVYHSPFHAGGTSPDNRGNIATNGTETIGQYAQGIGQDYRDLYANNNSRLYNAGVDWQNLSADTVLPANVSLVY